MSTIIVTDEEGVRKEIEAKDGVTLMAILREHSYDIPAICGGSCSCGTCHVLIDQEWQKKLPDVSNDEDLLLMRQTQYDLEKSRLACQITFDESLDGLHLTLLEES